MPKRIARSQRPEITLDQYAAAPLYKQLYERLRAEILSGQLEAGARLPSTRTLASELGVSRNTTALAYEQLLMEGYIESKVGDGTRVAHLQPEQTLQVRRSGRRPTANRQPVTRDELLGRRGQLLAGLTWLEEEMHPDGTLNTAFRIGQPDVMSFPYEIWARLISRHARQSLSTFTAYADAQGYAPLREAIAAHIGITRGVHCSPEQIILTAGAQGALDLLARVLLDPGDVAWVEDPGYPGARGALLGAGATLVQVPVDQEGIDVEAGRRLCQQARLAVVTPSHQFPTGVTMSLNRRLALLEWCREARAWIVEDDYDSEFRFSGRPLEALQGLDSRGRVIYIGTFSKVLIPSLRLGYLIVPPALLKGMVATRRLIDVYLPLLEQLALTDFIVEGHFARHLRKMRIQYLERRNTLVEGLRKELGDRVDVMVPQAGMHLMAWLPTGLDARHVARQTTRHGLLTTPIVQNSQHASARQGLMLGFANATSMELEAAVKILARTFKEL
ncbi:GntR family transcriptional regulator [Dictyobacter sp. S3.2.2.5]|uniref:GntR family transcriptional regulator n=1 Tax=Dictyobacter halimunensis TaxID=3026934 RepID=A0ABQ6FMV5_9CHLR|nr:GntR family transcriptional regulator [Dictyobacter sp. S3.2.2.5]